MVNGTTHQPQQAPQLAPPSSSSSSSTVHTTTPEEYETLHPPLSKMSSDMDGMVGEMLIKVWQFLIDELMDDTAEKLLMMIEEQRQKEEAESSRGRKRKRTYFSKKKKVSASGAYTSLFDAHTNVNIDDNEAEVRPICQKTVKGKKEAKTADQNGNKIDEMCRIYLNAAAKSMEAMNELIEVLKEMNEVMKEMNREDDFRFLYMDKSHMTEEQLKYHKMACNEIIAKYDLI